MQRKEYLLIQAASECNEVAHRITKALQFGLDEMQAGGTETNAEQIMREYFDLLGVMHMLIKEGGVTSS